MSDGIELLIEGKVAHVVLSRPDRRNAFDTAMLARFEDILQELGRNRGIEVAVLRARGTTFCAGSDLKELERLSASDTLHWQRRTGEIVERWARLDITTLTAFNGPAVGSGAVVGLASDIRVATDDTYFIFPEVAFGIPLTWSGIPLLTPLLGADRLKRALLLKEKLGIEELKQLGLFARIVPQQELVAATAHTVEVLLATSLLARQMTKRAIAASVAAPGFATGAFEPVLASLGILAREQDGFAFGKDPLR